MSRLEKLRRQSYGLLACAALGVLAKIAVQLYIQLRPRITPPAVGWLLHSKARQRYRSFERTVGYLGLAPEQRVLEVGGGTGAFTMPVAAAVQPGGIVCSVELQAGMLAQQRRRVAASGLPNIRLHRADAHRLPFRPAVFDRVVVIACLPMLADKQQALRELRRVLEPSGLLIVSEELIEPEYVPLAVTRAWCRRAGFREVAAYRDPFFYTLICAHSGKTEG